MWAVIDIGSNTIRLVLYSLENGKPHPMLNKKYPAGLAGYIDAANNIRPKGIQSLLEVLSDIQTILSSISHEEVFPFATAALRNSANGEAVISLIKEKTGLEVRILSGEEEATFDYYGAAQDGIGDSGLLADVGGGSTELTFFQGGEILTATSIPLGSLNLYRSYVSGVIPTEKEARKIRRAVRDYLDEIVLPEGEISSQPIYSVGGTARAALKIMQDCYALGSSNEYTRLHLKDFISLIDSDPRELLQDILRLAPDRVHTVIPGLLVFQTVAKHYGSASFVTSRFGVREGYLIHCLKEKGYMLG